MASIYFRESRSGGLWWAKYYHPITSECLRDSLGTADRARAELLRRRLEIEIELARPEIASVEIPEKIRARLGVEAPAPRLIEAVTSPVAVASPAVAAAAETVPASPAYTDTSVQDALSRYYRFIVDANDAHHVRGKMSILRAFFGTATVTAATGVGCQNQVPGYYHEPTVAGITAKLLQDFFEHLQVSKKTKKHYREVLHHLVEKLIDFEMYRPVSIHRPNPVATLPSFEERNEVITYLNETEMAVQRAALSGNPSILMAVEIMVGAGLRREEVLGLRRTDIANDVRQLNVVRYIDPDSGKVRKLKTGSRKLPISDDLREKLLVHMATLEGTWLIPGPGGARWSGDWFSKSLAALNERAGIRWTCHEYRHTYATNLASAGASLLKIARRLGDTYQTAERYYAQFVDDELE